MKYAIFLVDVDADDAVNIGSASLPPAFVSNSEIHEKAAGAVRKFEQNRAMTDGQAKSIRALTHSAIRVEHRGSKEIAIVHAKSGIPLMIFYPRRGR